MAESPRIEGLGLEELKSLLVQVLEDNARLKTENSELRDEIARLKGLKGRPTIKPSGMQAATEPRPRPVARRAGVDRSAPSSPSTRPRSSRR
ncbi:MAG: hypothetical protein WAN86_02565 [Hyphomicrobiaceae bacterium]